MVMITILIVGIRITMVSTSFCLVIVAVASARDYFGHTPRRFSKQGISLSSILPEDTTLHG